MKKILVIAVHPDDETLGAGATLLMHKNAGDELHWLIVTSGKGLPGFDGNKIDLRNKEIAQVAKAYGFKSVVELDLPAASLDALPPSQIISKLGEAINSIKPETLYVPWAGDAHSDHAVVMKCLRPYLKAFRYPWLKTVLAMETVSETNEAVVSEYQAFIPNWWVDVTTKIEDKIEIMRMYTSEIAPAPFPRSEEVIRALATVRGSQTYVKAAEGFRLILKRS